MRQFDVCRNPGTSRDGFPYLVVVQSDEFVGTDRRIVVPLTPHRAGYPAIAPVFDVAGQAFVADTLLIFAIPKDRLGAVVASLAEDRLAARLLTAVGRVLARA